MGTCQPREPMSLPFRAAAPRRDTEGGSPVGRRLGVAAKTAIASRRRGNGVHTPQARLRSGPCDVLVVGTVPGFVPDGERVAQAFHAFLPDVVALGVPPE